MSEIEVVLEPKNEILVELDEKVVALTEPIPDLLLFYELAKV